MSVVNLRELKPSSLLPEVFYKKGEEESFQVMAATLPRTLGELQLYRILQRANLLCYYDAFIQQGGDDVQQLCEAAEDEFLEIMALVGMASKPLHVRRLQKALRDWVTNPALFNQPLASLPVCSIPVYKLPDGPVLPVKVPKTDPPKTEAGSGSSSATASPLLSGNEPRFWAERSLSPAELGSPSSPLPRDTLEALDIAAVQAVSECVDRMARALPKSDPAELREQLKANKKLAKMIGHIFDLSDDDPRREEEIRKYSAIYGRFDSKRKDGKHLTLHELTVNEAAAQLCIKEVALLTRRDELFGLARQVSREVTYKYTYRTSKSRCGDRDEPSPKRIKTEQEGFFDLQEALQAIHMRQESLREQLNQARSKGEETLTRNIQVQLERLLAKQMEILHDAATQDRLQALEWRVPPGAVKHHAELHANANTNGVQSSTDKHTEQHVFISHIFPKNEESESEGQRKAPERWRNLSGLMERPPEVDVLRSCCCAVVVVGGGGDGLAACITCASLFLRSISLPPSLSLSLSLSVSLFLSLSLCLFLSLSLSFSLCLSLLQCFSLSFLGGPFGSCVWRRMCGSQEDDEDDDDGGVI